MEFISYIPNWVKKSVVYHIYPFGFFEAPKYNNDNNRPTNRFEKLRNYYDYFQKLGITTIQFGPIFESVAHGYDTSDFRIIDRRLGTNDLFKTIVKELHDLGIRVIIDGVFNHVGRKFFSFQDILKENQNSQYNHWHFINYSRNNPFNDGFDYKNWEGHYSLVKLNLVERDVREYIFSMVSYWMKEIGIDGWRLDVAYLLPIDFIKELRRVCDSINPETFLIGELIHPPYSKWVGEDRLHSGTAYNVYKSIWSAIASDNMYELKAVLEQSFHLEWGQNKDLILMNFLGNHDNTRIASILQNTDQLKIAFTILFTLNGIPKIYYGDELGTLGIKTEKSDDDVRRPMIDVGETENNNILSFVQELAKIRQKNHALIYGKINGLYADPVSGKILSFLRQSSKQSLLVVINSGDTDTIITIPFWNLGLEGKRFRDSFENEEYYIINSQLANLFIPKMGNRLLEMC